MSKQIELDKIRLDGGTQMRDEIDYHTVDDYSHAYAAGIDMPELTVFCDGSTNWLGDGFHRWHGAKKAGKKSVQCHVRQGSQRDAILFAAGANDANGLRRTPKDKMIAVRRLLLDEEWGKRSDRWVAEAARVSDHFVAEQRKQLPQTTTANSRSERIGKDGRVQPAKRITRKPVVPAHVPPIDEEEIEPPKLEVTPRPPLLKVRDFDDEHNLVRALADLVQIVKKTHYKASIDKGRLMHDLNNWANEIAEAIEEAEAK